MTYLAYPAFIVSCGINTISLSSSSSSLYLIFFFSCTSTKNFHWSQSTFFCSSGQTSKNLKQTACWELWHRTNCQNSFRKTMVERYKIIEVIQVKPTQAYTFIPHMHVKWHQMLLLNKWDIPNSGGALSGPLPLFLVPALIFSKYHNPTCKAPPPHLFIYYFFLFYHLFFKYCYLWLWMSFVWTICFILLPWGLTHDNCI